MSKNAKFIGQPIFSQLLKIIPKHKIVEIVNSHNSDHLLQAEKDKVDYLPEKINRKDFLERDLHKLLCSYLKSSNTFSKSECFTTARISAIADVSISFFSGVFLQEIKKKIEKRRKYFTK